MFDGSETHECKAAGTFRNDGITPIVGDYVFFDSEKKFIEKIEGRKNSLIRPPVSNIDQIIIVVSPVNPAPDYFMIDKLTALAISKGITPIIAINKIDLKNYKELEKTYKKLFPVIKLAAKMRKNISKIRKVLKGKTSALAGNSGVGKSTIIKALGLAAEVGETSKIQRGKHTTRHVELMQLGRDSFIMDTPGFSMLDTEIEGSIIDFFPEISGTKCLFTDCTHKENAKGCEVYGKMSKSRYESLMELIK
ncbi:MAG: ribosome small subunit-dependent GTPase A [Oscillospiraceae bacterium]|nr:ribosome small subunit-dependent GTPase A [Oscillospiraceae bacterium]